MQNTKSTEPVEIRVVGTGVLESGHGFYLVPSESDPTRCYVVEQWPSKLECRCKDAFFRQRQCKHIRAVMAHKARLQLAEADQADASIAEECASRATLATPSAAKAAAYRQSSHPGDTALLRRDNRPFAERFMR